MRHRVLLAVVALWMVQAMPLLAAPEPGASDRPKIGLVLSGGGARGAAHLGVLRELERQHIPVDYIAGTSMGAIIGGLYASGMAVDEIEKALAEIDWADILKDEPERSELSYRRKRDDDDFLVRQAFGIGADGVKLPAGMLQGQKLLLLLKELTRSVANVQDFDKLPVPFRAVATDISNGQAVVIGSGDLALAMRASSSIPSAFAPVKWDGKLLVDGGVADNLPVAVVKLMGADRVIAVDISTHLYQKEELTNLLVIADQLTTLMTRSNTERSLERLGGQDVLIVPELGDITTTSFTLSMQAIEPGEKATRDAQDKLAHLAVPADSYQAASVGVEKLDRPVIAFIEINNRSGLDDAVIRSRIKVPLGEPLDNQRLEHDIATLYGMELFESISYDLIEKDGKQGLRLNVVEKTWGPDYMQAGIALNSRWQSGSGFTLGASYLQTNINPLGGEWRSMLNLGESPLVFTELYQPLDTESHYFFNPGVEWSRKTIGLYSDGNHLADYQMAQTEFFLEGGRELGRWGEIRAGYSYASGSFELDIGAPYWPNLDYDSGMVFLQLGVDTLDSRYFATQGDLGVLKYSVYSEALGGDDDFDQVSLSWFSAHSVEKTSLLASMNVGITPDDDAAFYGRYTLGGFTKLSGYNQYELSGQQMAHVLVGGMYQMVDMKFLPVYLGAMLEAGNTWERLSNFGDDWKYSASVFVGVDSFIGPLYVGFASSEDHPQSLFMYLGTPF